MGSIMVVLAGRVQPTPQCQPQHWEGQEGAARQAGGLANMMSACTMRLATLNKPGAGGLFLYCFHLILRSTDWLKAPLSGCTHLCWPMGRSWPISESCTCDHPAPLSSISPVSPAPSFSTSPPLVLWLITWVSPPTSLHLHLISSSGQFVLQSGVQVRRLFGCLNVCGRLFCFVCDKRRVLICHIKAKILKLICWMIVISELQGMLRGSNSSEGSWSSLTSPVYVYS